MNTDNRNQMQENIFIIFILVQAMIINFNFLIFRLFLHYKFRSGASVLAFKNLLVIATNFTKVIRYVCCEEEEKPVASRGQTPSNTEDSPSVIQSNRESSRMGGDTSCRFFDKENQPEGRTEEIEAVKFTRGRRGGRWCRGNSCLELTELSSSE